MLTDIYHPLCHDKPMLTGIYHTLCHDNPMLTGIYHPLCYNKPMLTGIHHPLCHNKPMLTGIYHPLCHNKRMLTGIYHPLCHDSRTWLKIIIFNEIDLPNPPILSIENYSYGYVVQVSKLTQKKKLFSLRYQLKFLIEAVILFRWLFRPFNKFHRLFSRTLRTWDRHKFIQ